VTRWKGPGPKGFFKKSSNSQAGFQGDVGNGWKGKERKGRKREARTSKKTRKGKKGTMARRSAGRGGALYSTQWGRRPNAGGKRTADAAAGRLTKKKSVGGRRARAFAREVPLGKIIKSAGRDWGQFGVFFGGKGGLNRLDREGS